MARAECGAHHFYEEREHMSELALQDLLKAGVHFGHQTHKWNPKMRPYVYGEANGIYIIDLAKTITLAKRAFDFLRGVSAQKRPILFVGTKRQASEVIRKAATSCGAFHVTYRWPGGMLTNHKTINLSIDKLRKVERMREAGDFEFLTKKERFKIEKDVLKLERGLGGIRDMRKMPGALFTVDPNSERIAVCEANKLGIPVIAVTDTNCNPEGIDFVVPGNDDAIKSIQIFADYFAMAVLAGAGHDRVGESDGVPKEMELESEIISKFEKDIDLQDDGPDGEEGHTLGETPEVAQGEDSIPQEQEQEGEQ